MDPGNWQGDVAPTPGDDLVFPAGPTSLTSTDDYPSGTAFGSITIADTGYQIGGNDVALSGTIQATQASGSSTVTLPLTLATPTTVTVNNAGATLVLGGPIDGAGGIDLQGAGTLDLTATNTYTGTTTVDGGILLVDGAQSGSPVAVNAEGTLGGGGTVGTIGATGGTVRAGSTAPAILTTTGNLNLSGTTTFAVALDSATAGTGYGQVDVGGQVNLDGATLSPTLGFTPTGNAQFTIINNTGTAAVNGTFAGLAQGATTTIGGQPFSISYTGGTGNDVVLTQQVASTTALSVSPSSAVFGQAVTLTATVSAGGTGTTATPTGTVTFLDGTTTLGTGTLANGVATLTTTTLPVGSDAITAQYAGDLNFTGSTSGSNTVTVSAASTTTAITASPNTSVFGQPVALTATVTPVSPGAGSPTGTVTFTAGSTTLGTATVTSGVASLSTAALPVGVDTVVATFQSGNGNFAGSTSTGGGVTVSAAGTITSLALSSSTAVFGQPLTLTATVGVLSPGAGSPTGIVTFQNGTTVLGTGTVTNGKATLTTSSLPVGNDSITATYGGDGNFASGSSQATTATITQASTTTTLAVSPTTAAFGQSVTLTATVAPVAPGAGTPTGTVTFINGTTTLGTGTLSGNTATLTTSSLALGSQSVIAVYQGDGNFATSTSATSTVTVGTSNAIVGLTTSNANPGANQSVTFTATVAATSGTGTPTGSVVFLANGVALGSATLSNGTATLTTAANLVPGQGLPLGNVVITAVYQGDTNFNATSSAAMPIVVGDALTRFLNQVYLDVLHRPIDQVGLNSWYAELQSGVSRAKVVDRIINSREALTTAFVTASQTYLDTTPTASQVSGALQAVQSAPRYTAGALFLGSNAFYQDQGSGTPQGFANGLYLAVLGTDPTSEQSTEVTDALKRGVSRTEIAQQLLQSQQARTTRVNDYYQAILGRPADTKGLDDFVGFLGRGGRNPQVIAALLSSEEFLADINAGQF